MSASRVTFEHLAAELDYAMFIVTTRGGGELGGCLVGFATQTSIHPPRFLACLSRRNHTLRVASAPDADTLVVHFVPEDATDLAELFGGETGDEVNKFSRCAWHPGAGGVPVLDDLENWFAGRVRERIDLGDHVGFLLEPIDGAAAHGEDPLTFHRARRIEPGHAP